MNEWKVDFNKAIVDHILPLIISFLMHCMELIKYKNCSNFVPFQSHNAPERDIIGKNWIKIKLKGYYVDITWYQQ